MKRAVINEITQLHEKLQGHVYMMFFGYANLCVKADPASLIPVSVMIEGKPMKIEEVATLAKRGDYEFAIVPKIDEDLMTIAQGIASSHPEFKQERQTMDVELSNGKHRDIPYLLLTMPEVDDNRYDLLKNAVKSLYDVCKSKMTVANAQTDAKLAALCADENPEEVDNMRKALEEQREMWDKHRDKLRDDKLKEIEEGHQHWMTQKEEHQQQRSGDNSVATSMRLNQE